MDAAGFFKDLQNHHSSSHFTAVLCGPERACGHEGDKEKPLGSHHLLPSCAMSVLLGFPPVKRDCRCVLLVDKPLDQKFQTQES